jgi:hypothetical protein
VDSITERNQEIAKLRLDGWSTRQISKKFTISHQRVSQILHRSGIETEIPATTLRLSKAKEKAGLLTYLYTDEFREKMGIGRIAASAIFSKFRHAIRGDGNIQKGQAGEAFVSELLTANGIKNELMPFNHPFDILLGNGKTIDVKTALSPKKSPSQRGHPYYDFRTRKTGNKRFDFYAFVLYDVKEVYFIPFDEVPVADKFRVAQKPRKYASYKNAFHLLK